MIMEIMFDDLTKDAQIRLLGEVGIDDPEEMGWDVKPIAVVNFDDDKWDYEDEEEDDDDGDYMDDYDDYDDEDD
jgi:hypothetical protein